MGAGAKIWGWYKTGGVWVPIRVNADGKLLITPA